MANAFLVEGSKMTELNADFTETLEAVAFYKLVHHVIEINHADDVVSMGSLSKTILGLKAQIRENEVKLHGRA